jgi:diguanylate cyclase
MLPEAMQQRRQQVILRLLWAHVPVLAVLGLLAGAEPVHLLVEVGGVAALAGTASALRSRRERAALVTVLGLLSSSAVLVHLFDGLTELHFHYFVMVGVIALYQNWPPYLLAIAYVVVQHGVVGVIAPGGVYDDAAAVAAPWAYALLHGAFILAMAATGLASWRFTESLLGDLAHRATHDPLTDLANGVRFREAVDEALAACRRDGTRLAVAYLDLDGFKTVNDSLGHDVGDALLVVVADRLRACAPEASCVARLGGDEFALLLEDVDGPDAAARVAADVAVAVSVPAVVGGRAMVVTSSTGIALGAAGSTAEQLLRDADLAMYAAKAQGVGRAEVFRPSLHDAALQRLHLLADLRDALEADDELVVVYQPVVALPGGRVEGVEALLRWTHPERGPVPPATFIPLAEQSGLIDALGRRVLAEACRAAHGWRTTTGRDDLRVAVNLSPSQLGEAELVEQVARVLAATGLPARALVLEITEDAVMADPEEALRQLHRLRDLGVVLAVDDFGTGRSSLAHLQRFPVEVLKVDRTFVEALDREGSTPIVEDILRLAHSLGLRAVAEGVERPGQLAALEAMGCDSVQGLLLSPPRPAEQVAELLSRPRLAVRPPELVALDLQALQQPAAR